MTMELRFNVTYITLDGFAGVHRSYRYLCFVIFLTVYILILGANSTIVCLIMIHKNLHEPMYVFIAALLINSVLYSTLIYPKLLTDFLSDRQIISFSACLFQFLLFYSLGGSEFLLLAAMAYDRYVSICKPLQYPAIMRRQTVTAFLVSSWVVPVSLVAGGVTWSSRVKLCRFILRGIFCNNSFHMLHCVSPRGLSVLGLITLITIALLPLLYICFTYIKIFIVSYRSSQDVRTKAAQTCVPHLLVLVTFTLFGTYESVIRALEADIPRTQRFIMTLQIVLYHPLFNPIIYGLKMKEISKHLKKLFS